MWNKVRDRANIKSGLTQNIRRFFAETHVVHDYRRMVRPIATQRSKKSEQLGPIGFRCSRDDQVPILICHGEGPTESGKLIPAGNQNRESQDDWSYKLNQ
jgi:hypothetical protein